MTDLPEKPQPGTRLRLYMVSGELCWVCVDYWEGNRCYFTNGYSLGWLPHLGFLHR